MPEGNQKLHPLENIRGVGPKIAESLSILGILQVEDAVFHLPYKYEDRTQLISIGDAPYEVPLLIEGEIVKSTVVFRGKRMLITEIFDGTGRLTMRMFHFAMAQHKTLKEGYKIRCFGVIRHGPKGKEMIHPQYRVFAKDEEIGMENSLTPVYPSTSGLQQGRLRKIIQEALIYCQQNKLLKESWTMDKENDFADLLSALAFIHNPPTETDLEMLRSGQHPAQRKLIKEELEELEQALNDKNLLEVADALTDILYVTYGAGHSFGINLDVCFEEVQRSNMSKLDEDGKPIYNEYGKVMKGPNFSKPNLKQFI